MRKVLYIFALLLLSRLGYSLPGDKLATNMTQALADPTSVTMLSLKGQGIKSLPADIEKLTNLELLDLSYNSFTIVPPCILKLKNLKILYLNNNALVSLPSDISALSSLAVLRLDYNPFASPATELKKVCAITTLSELNFSANHLNAFPAELLNLSRLTYLDLGYGTIKELPQDIDKLASLKRLVLTKNLMSDFPAAFFKLSNLKNIDISYNSFIRLQDDFVTLSLESMDVSYNKDLISIPVIKGLRYINVKKTKLDIEKLKWDLGEGSMIMM